ncbi:MAG: hypothetical protein IJZ72_05450 [Oscillospiraceae bacterium]|nr:hypothetical protein [Oscillospiraceae bacterium]
MTEKIIRRLTEITGLASQLDLGGDGTVAAYPESTEIKEHFCDGGRLVSVRVRLSLKGRTPSQLFERAEAACKAADESPEGDIIYRTELTPKLDSCTEAGVYIVSCVINAEYIMEAEDEDSI